MSQPSHPDSFEALVEPHLMRLYRLAYRFTGSAADAEDLVQDVLVKLYPRAAQLRAIETLGPWLARVLYNQFVDDKRRAARRRLRTVSIDDPEHERAVRDALAVAPHREPAGAIELDITAIDDALAKLSIEHRAVVLLHDCEGYKLEEIAALTGAALGTVKSRLHRARARLREMLIRHGTF